MIADSRPVTWLGELVTLHSQMGNDGRVLGYRRISRNPGEYPLVTGCQRYALRSHRPRPRRFLSHDPVGGRTTPLPSQILVRRAPIQESPIKGLFSESEGVALARVGQID